EPRRRRFNLRAWAAAAALAAFILVGAAIWIGYGHAPAKPHPTHVTVRPFEALTDSEDVRSLARRIPNEVVNQLGDSQIEAVLGSGQASGESSKMSVSPPGL